jgi:hypothetical protein
MHPFARLALTASVTLVFSAAACGGDVVVDDDSSGSGGSGASPSAPTSSSSSSSSGLPSNTVSSSSSSSSGVSTSSGRCQTCADALDNGQLPVADVCPGQSQSVYDALVFCLCASVCAGACSDNLCTNNGITDECGECVQTSCLSQLQDCANDF